MDGRPKSAAESARRLTECQSSGHRLHNCLGVSRWSFAGAQQAEITLRHGDTIVLCSDGLTDYLGSVEALAELAAPCVGPADLANDLVNHALACGGHYNVTVVCVMVD